MNIEEKIAVSQSYTGFRTLISALLAEGKTTGTNQSEDMINFATLNEKRMQRLDKTVKLNDDLVSAIKNVDGKHTWLMIAEGWCGDVAQNLPVVAKLAEHNPNIDLRIILRDENLDLMDEHLTDGGRSIPKLLWITDENETITTWGPRPAPMQEMMVNYKNMDPATKPAYRDFAVEIHKWYAKDKTQTFQNELTTWINDAL